LRRQVLRRRVTQGRTASINRWLVIRSPPAGVLLYGRWESGSLWLVLLSKPGKNDALVGPGPTAACRRGCCTNLRPWDDIRHARDVRPQDRCQGRLKMHPLAPVENAPPFFSLSMPNQRVGRENEAL